MNSLLETVVKEINCWKKSSTPPVSDALPSAPLSPSQSVRNAVNSKKSSTSTVVSYQGSAALQGVGKGSKKMTSSSLRQRDDDDDDDDDYDDARDRRRRQAIATNYRDCIRNMRQVPRQTQESGRSSLERARQDSLLASSPPSSSSRKRQRVFADASANAQRRQQQDSLRGAPQDHESSTSSTSDSDNRAPSSTTSATEGPGDTATSIFSPCDYEGCAKPSMSNGRRFCRRHGEGRRCKTIGCNKVDVGGGSCRRHGGGRRCGADGCLKTDVGGGFCVSHGGGKRCQAQDCQKGAQAGGVFCKSHGGGRRCRIDGCMTSAQSGADVLCIKHGGGKRCMVSGCQKLVRKNNRCTKHAAEASVGSASATRTSSATSSPQQSPTSAPLSKQTPQTQLSEPIDAACSNRFAKANSSPSLPVEERHSDRRNSELNCDSLLPSLPVSKPAVPDDAPSGSGDSVSTGRRGLPRRLPDVSPTRFLVSHNVAGSSRVRIEKGIPPPPPLVGASSPVHEQSLSPGPSITHDHFSGLSAVAAARAQPRVYEEVVPHSDNDVVPDVGVANSDWISPHLWRRLAPPVPNMAAAVEAATGGAPARKLSGAGGDWLPKSQSTMEPEASSLTRSSAPTGTAAAAAATAGVIPPRAVSPGFSIGVPGLRCDGGIDGVPAGSGVRLPQQERARDKAPGAQHTNGRFPANGEDRNPTPSPPLRGISAPSVLPSISCGIANVCSAVRETSAERMVEVSDSTTCPILPRLANLGGYDTCKSNGVYANVLGPSYVRGLSPTANPLGFSSAVSGVTASLGCSMAPSMQTLPMYSGPALAPTAFPSSTFAGAMDKTAAIQDQRRSSPDDDYGAAGRFDACTSYPPGERAAGWLPQHSGDPDVAIHQRRRAGWRYDGGGRGACCAEEHTFPSLVAFGPRRDCSPVPDAAAAKRRRSASPQQPTTKYISLSVVGMMCMTSCGQTVQRALSAVDGVRSVTVHFPTRTASVEVDTNHDLSVNDLIKALGEMGFSSTCVATSTTEEPLDDGGVNAVWAIASALGLVDHGCAMAWGDPCTCGDDCQCVNCPQHMQKVSKAVDLVVQAMDLSTADSPPEQPNQLTPSKPPDDAES